MRRTAGPAVSVFFERRFIAVLFVRSMAGKVGGFYVVSVDL